MKLINKILKLTIFTTLLFFSISCEKDSLENYTNGNEITNSNKALKLKPISYNALAWVGLIGDGPINNTTGLPTNPTIAWQNLPQSQRLQIIAIRNNFLNNNPPCQ